MSFTQFHFSSLLYGFRIKTESDRIFGSDLNILKSAVINEVFWQNETWKERNIRWQWLAAQVRRQGFKSNPLQATNTKADLYQKYCTTPK